MYKLELAVFVLAALGAAVRAQEPEAKPPPIDVAPIVDQLEEAIADREMARDLEAAGLLNRLAQAFDGLEKKEQKDVLRAVDKVFLRTALRAPDSQLYRAAADAFGQMGDDGARALQRIHDASRFPTKPEWAAMRANVIEAAGKTQSDKAVGFIGERIARAAFDEELAAAGRAAGYFGGADQRTRKELVKQLVNKLGGLESMASQPRVNDPSQPEYFGAETARRTLGVVRRPFLAALTALTGVEHQDGTAWQHWYNKNKASNWDQLRKNTHPYRNGAGEAGR